MLKTPKINVLRGKMTVEIPVNPGSVESLKDAAGKLTSLYEHAIDFGAQVAMPEPHVARIPEPPAEPVEGNLDPPESTPEAADDPLDIPPHMVRTRAAK